MELKESIYSTVNLEIIKLLEKYGSEIEKRVGVSIYHSCDFVGISFLTETMLETWEIDCRNI